MKIEHLRGEKRRIIFTDMEQHVLTAFLFATLAGLIAAGVTGLAILVVEAF